MQRFLVKLKLIDHLITEIEIPKSQFILKFKGQVDSEEIGHFSDLFDVFSSSKNEYKGQVGQDSFKIKRRRRFFDMNLSSAIAKGTMTQTENILVIQTEINGFNNMVIPYYIVLVLFYSVFIGMFLFSGSVEGSVGFLVFPFVIIHAAFMFGIPYFIMRKGTKRLKYDLERELFYMAKK